MVRRVEPIALPAGAIRVANILLPGGASRPIVQRTPWPRSIEAKHAPDLILEVIPLSIDPVVVMETLRFYAAYPLLRHELGTQAAIDRVRRGDLTHSMG